MKKSRTSSAQIGTRRPGRPSIEDQHPEFGETLMSIMGETGAADGRRRDVAFYGCRTVRDLQAALNEKGFIISKSHYSRISPTRVDTMEAKRHPNSYPVKSLKPEEDLHSPHIDSSFCFEVIKMVKTIAAICGSAQVTTVSADDKAKVPIGIVVANKQTKVLMRVTHKVHLPDHTFCIANRHKLIPSVYAFLQIIPDEVTPAAVTYKGPLYIAIRSMKDSSSNAYTHSRDFERAYELPEFYKNTR